MSQRIGDAARLQRTARVDEVRAIVAGSGAVEALGTRHPFSASADTTGDPGSLERPDRVPALDPVRRTLTVEGGIDRDGTASGSPR